MQPIKNTNTEPNTQLLQESLMIAEIMKAQEYALARPVYNEKDYERAGGDPGQSKVYPINNLYNLSVITFVAPHNGELADYNWHFVASMRLKANMQKPVALAYLNNRQRDILKKAVRDAADGVGDQFSGEKLKISSHTIQLIRPLTIDEEDRMKELVEEIQKQVAEEVTKEPKLENIFKIGENNYGYWFGVGQVAGFWYGFAVGQVENNNEMIFFLPGCDELELPEDKKADVRNEVIRRVGAVAQSIEHGYGGIKRWFVEEHLRGRSEDYMCDECGSVMCTPEHHSLGDSV